MNKDENGAWWKIGFVMVLCMNLVRELVVLIFGIPQKGTLLLNARPWFDVQQLHVAWQMLCSVFGAAVMAMVICMLFGGKREDGESLTRNAAIGTVIGFIVAPVLGMEADLIQWMWIVIIVTAGAGLLMGMERIMVSDMYWGFGVLFGAALVLSMTYGFGIAGALLFLAVGMGLVATGIGWILGAIVDFVIKHLSARRRVS